MLAASRIIALHRRTLQSHATELKLFPKIAEDIAKCLRSTQVKEVLFFAAIVHCLGQIIRLERLYIKETPRKAIQDLQD